MEDFEAADVANTMFVYERLVDDPLPAEHYLRIRAMRLDPETGHRHDFSEHQLAPPLPPEMLEARDAKRKELTAARLAKWQEDADWVSRKMPRAIGHPPRDLAETIVGTGGCRRSDAAAGGTAKRRDRPGHGFWIQ